MTDASDRSVLEEDKSKDFIQSFHLAVDAQHALYDIETGGGYGSLEYAIEREAKWREEGEHFYRITVEKVAE